MKEIAKIIGMKQLKEVKTYLSIAQFNSIIIQTIKLEKHGKCSFQTAFYAVLITY